MKHRQRCNQQVITSIKTSNESHLLLKNHSQNNPIHFRIYADFDADKENSKSSPGNKTPNIFQQNPVCNC